MLCYSLYFLILGQRKVPNQLTRYNRSKFRRTTFYIQVLSVAHATSLRLFPVDGVVENTIKRRMLHVVFIFYRVVQIQFNILIVYWTAASTRFPVPFPLSCNSGRSWTCMVNLQRLSDEGFLDERAKRGIYSYLWITRKNVCLCVRVWPR